MYVRGCYCRYGYIMLLIANKRDAFLDRFSNQ